MRVCINRVRKAERENTYGKMVVTIKEIGRKIK